MSSTEHALNPEVDLATLRHSARGVALSPAHLEALLNGFQRHYWEAVGGNESVKQVVNEAANAIASNFRASLLLLWLLLLVQLCLLLFLLLQLFVVVVLLLLLQLMLLLLQLFLLLMLLLLLLMIFDHM